jgi:hypothetical protein
MAKRRRQSKKPKRARQGRHGGPQSPPGASLRLGNQPPEDTNMEARKPYRRAVVLVHGIGNQRPGSLTLKWGDALSSAIGDVLGLRPTRYTYEPLPSAKAGPLGLATVSPYEFVLSDSVRRQPCILIVESIWAKSFRRPNGLRTALWVVRSLPMFAFLLGFDQRDASLKEFDHRPIRPADYVTSAGILGRLILRVSILWAFLIAAYWAVTRQGWLALMLACIVLAALLIPYFNIVGHVRVAAAATGEFAKTADKVSSDISSAERVADSVMVVAHSQGGFVVHQLLESGKHQGVDKFLGVGSGLKPITLLRDMQDRRLILYQWLAISGIILLQVALAAWLKIWDLRITPDHPMMPFVSFALNFVIAPEPADFFAGVGPPADYLTLGTLGWALAILAGLALVTVSYRKVGALPRVDIAPLPSVRWWKEVSSHLDVVGRSLLPPTPPGCTELSVPVSGNPLTDHVRYFKRDGFTPTIAAEELVRDTGSTPGVEFGSALSDAAWRVQRVVQLRSWLCIGFIASTALPFLGISADVSRRVFSVSVLLLLALLVISAPLLMLWQARMLKKLRRRVLAGQRPTVPETESWEKAGRALTLVICGGIGVFTTASGLALSIYGMPAGTIIVLMGWSTMALGVAIAAGFWNRSLILFGFFPVYSAGLIWVAEPALPKMPYPLGQAGWLASVLCVIAIVFTVSLKNRAFGCWVAERFARLAARTQARWK